VIIFVVQTYKILPPTGDFSRFLKRGIHGSGYLMG